MESKGSFEEGKRERKHVDDKGYDDWDDDGKDIDSDDEVSCTSRCCVEKKVTKRQAKKSHLHRQPARERSKCVQTRQSRPPELTDGACECTWYNLLLSQTHHMAQ